MSAKMLGFGHRSILLSFFVVVSLQNSPTHAHGPYSRTRSEDEQWGGVGGGHQPGGYGQQGGSSYPPSEGHDNHNPPGYEQEGSLTHSNQFGSAKENYFARQYHIEKYGSPEGCVKVDTSSCNYFVEISREKDDPDFIHFELSGKLQANGGYVAVGLSEDKIMGEDHIVECKHLNDNTESYSVSWSVGKTLPKRLEDDISIIKMDERYPRYDAYNQTLTCKFRRPIETSVNVDNGRYRTLNLVRGQYHILLARGNMGRPNSDAIGFHGAPSTGNIYVSPGFLGETDEKYPDPSSHRRGGDGSRFSSGSGQFLISARKGIPIVFVFMFMSLYIH